MKTQLSIYNEHMWLVINRNNTYKSDVLKSYENVIMVQFNFLHFAKAKKCRTPFLSFSYLGYLRLFW